MLITSDELLSKYQKQICSNIKKLLDMHSINAVALSKSLNVSYSTIHRLTQPDSSPSIETLVKVAKYFNLSVAQVIGDIPLTEQDEFIHIREIPIIDLKNVNEFLSQKNNNTNSISSNKTLFASSKYESTDRAFAIISSDKFEPAFSRGTILLFDQLSSDYKNYDNKYVIIMTTGSDLSIKKLLIDNGDYYLKSINNDIPVQPLKETNKLLAVLIQTKIEFA